MEVAKLRLLTELIHITDFRITEKWLIMVNIQWQKVGRWDIKYRYSNNNPFSKMQKYQLIGNSVRGLYDDGLKNGKWTDLDEEFNKEKQVTYNCVYKNEIKIGRWDIELRLYSSDPISKINSGGGQYDDGNKMCNWIDLDEQFNQIGTKNQILNKIQFLTEKARDLHSSPKIRVTSFPHNNLYIYQKRYILKKIEFSLSYPCHTIFHRKKFWQNESLMIQIIRLLKQYLPPNLLNILAWISKCYFQMNPFYHDLNLSTFQHKECNELEIRGPSFNALKSIENNMSNFNKKAKSQQIINSWIFINLTISSSLYLTQLINKKKQFYDQQPLNHFRKRRTKNTPLKQFKIKGYIIDFITSNSKEKINQTIIISLHIQKYCLDENFQFTQINFNLKLRMKSMQVKYFLTYFQYGIGYFKLLIWIIKRY
ncbi:unnamed protein product [Paramecium pentaurelia]|uniref:Uncharacterized protein n=1 Tax=Paramecium pentaurelia TaxID=43138 RepID=A0A8S1S498_9CILI|nr:unnamed protein product [Paramecium pentaurelia]